MEEAVLPIKITPKNKMFLFLKKYQIFIFLISILSVLLLFKFIIPQATTPPIIAPPITPSMTIKPTLPPDPFEINLFWQGLIGQNKENLLSELGQPVKTEIIDKRSVNYFSSETENWPTQVFFSTDGKTVYSIKRFFPDKKETYLGFTKKYGPSDKKYFGEHSQSGFDIFVFDKEGMAIVANTKSNVILQVWYYPPNDINAFLTINKNEISETQLKVF